MRERTENEEKKRNTVLRKFLMRLEELKFNTIIRMFLKMINKEKLRKRVKFLERR